MLKKITATVLILSILSLGVLYLFEDELFYPSFEPTESTEFAASLGRGWNLANTFDACEKHSSEKAGNETETMWGNPETTKELIAYVKECGFDSVRIPVTWAQHLGDAPDYTIDSQWLDRVNTVVDWVLEYDMKAVLNVHHDDAFWLVTNEENKEISKEILTKIWAQLCDRFKDYDENLIFETMNEPRVEGSEDEWQGNEESREVVNFLNFAALETIRNGEGYNKTRFVMIPTYAASGLHENISALRLPENEHVIVSVHYYFGTAHQSEFADNEKVWSISDKASLYRTFRKMFDCYTKKGYGVVKSEFGWTDRDNIENLAENTKTYIELAEKFGFSCMVWDNGSSFGIIDRNELKTLYPEYMNAIVGKE